MVIFFLVFFTVYSAVNYYLFIRGWQALQGIPSLRIVYLVFFIIAALSYIGARMFYKHLPVQVYDILTWIGSIWFAYILYVFLFIVLIDLIRLGNHFFDFYPSYVKLNYSGVKQAGFFTVFIITTLIVIGGYVNTRSFKVTTIDLDIPKRSSTLSSLKTVVISDLHLSAVNDSKFLDKVVSEVNALEPDLILIPGDIVDDKSEYLSLKNNGPALRRLKAKYGVFASMGNHEFINGGEDSEKYILGNGLNLLRDKSFLIEEGLYIIGRDDSSKINFTGSRRKTLKEITADLDPEYPAFMMDHTPFRLEEASFNQIDLQVSGHTHHGQLFPLNFITSKIYEVSWGYKKKNNTHYYVTSGIGTWGPPVRTGSTSEIVSINIRFR